jgi:hypothetical protein
VTGRRAGLLAGCAAVALAAAGCQGAKEREIAEEAVRRYNRAVIEAHLTGSTAELEKAAGEREVERVQIFVGSLRAQGQLLLESLERLEIREAALEGQAGRAVAEERWSYERVDARTRQPVVARTRRDYVMRYLLARRGGGWVVDRVEFAEPSEDVAR